MLAPKVKSYSVNQIFDGVESSFLEIELKIGMIDSVGFDRFDLFVANKSGLIKFRYNSQK